MGMGFNGNPLSLRDIIEGVAKQSLLEPLWGNNGKESE
jgi:hypothetical protein